MLIADYHASAVIKSRVNINCVSHLPCAEKIYRRSEGSFVAGGSSHGNKTIFTFGISPSKGIFHSTGELEMKINHLPSSVNRAEMEEVNWQ